METENKGIIFKRHFTKENTHPFDEVEWNKKDAIVVSAEKKIVFEQKNVEFPTFYSQRAVDIIVSKYFKGKMGTSSRETSYKQLINRIVNTNVKWGEEQGYFSNEESKKIYSDELIYILLHQMVSFNSPVWFNMGFPGRPQTSSACFINKVEDDMDSILDWYKKEGTIFKMGSGSGINISKLRAKGESLSSGGTSSGALSFMKVADANASSIKSGGACLAPDQRVYTNNGPIPVKELAESNEDFIVLSYDPPAKRIKAKTARAWKSGYKKVMKITTDKGSFRLSEDHPVYLSSFEYVFVKDLKTGMSILPCEIYDSRGYLIVNLRDGKKGKEKIQRLILKDISGENIDKISTHHIDGNKYNNDISNLQIIKQKDHAYIRNKELVKSRTHIFQKNKYPHSGSDNAMHSGSDFWKNEEKVESYKEKQRKILIQSGRASEMQKKASKQKMINTAYKIMNSGGSIESFEKYIESRKKYIGRISSVDCIKKKIENQFGSYDNFTKEVKLNNHRVEKIEEIGYTDVYDVEVNCPTKDNKSPNSGHNFAIWSNDKCVGSGIFISNTRRAAKMIIMDVDHPEIIDFIQCKVKEEEKALALIREGYDSSFNGEAYSTVAFQNENHSVMVTDEFMNKANKKRNREFWTKYVSTGKKCKQYDAQTILVTMAEAACRTGCPGIQFEDTINKWNTCKSKRIKASNPCSEYFHIDNTSCNLASINLMKFFDLENGKFLIDDFIVVVYLITTAQDVWIDQAQYPNEDISRETKKYRTVGVGYSNLGALIMANGIPYDSDESRCFTSAITSLMSAVAYYRSAEHCSCLPSFPEYENNKESMFEVLDMHKNETSNISTNNTNKAICKKAIEYWDKSISLGKENGFRNSYVSNLAPTGCVSGETIIPTNNGLKRMKDIFSENTFDKYRDTNIEVWSNPTTKMATKFYTNGLGSTKKIINNFGQEFESTPNHKIKILNKFGKMTWKKVEDLKVGDIVPIALYGSTKDKNYVRLNPSTNKKHGNENKNFSSPNHLTENLAEFLGIYFGDGQTKERSIRITISNEDKDFMIPYLKNLVEKLFGIKMSKRIDKYEGCVGVSFNSKRLISFLENNNLLKKKSPEIQVPSKILESKECVQSAFVRGFFETNGSVSWSGITATSASSQFIQDLSIVLNSMGIFLKIDNSSNIHTSPSHKGKNIMNGIMISYSKSIKKYKEKIGFISQRKRNILEKFEFKSKKDIYSQDILDFFATSIGLKNAKSPTRRKKAKDYIFKNFGSKFSFSKIKSIQDSSCYTYDLTVPDGNSYLANGIVSHNTISLMMDCDTTGCEPELALVKYKRLAGSDAVIQIVNETVQIALKTLKYSEEDIEEIVKYIIEKNTVEKCPKIKKEHVPVFCSSFKGGGEKYIHYTGHLKMLTAIQPFVSGGISKTCNMPEEATKENIINVFQQAWEMGLKSITIFRDNCRQSQPITTLKEQRSRATRIKLPDDVSTSRHKFSIEGTEIFLHHGTYPDGTLGEIFFRVAKEGSTMSGLMDAFSREFSISLQYGIPLKVLVEKLINSKFDPMGWTGNKDIPNAHSVIDYAMRFLALKYLDEKERESVGIYSRSEKIGNITNKNYEKHKEESSLKEKTKQTTSTTCSVCGSIMVFSGSCKFCENCGNTTGCS